MKTLTVTSVFILLSLGSSAFAAVSVYFNGFAHEGLMHLEWTLINPEKVSKMMIEKSLDGFSFEVFETISPENQLLYLLVDDNPQEGINYYRLTIVNSDGTIEKSDVLSLEYAPKNITFKLYPNPSPGETYVFLPSNCSENHVYEIIVYNTIGQQIIRERLPRNKVKFELDNIVNADIYTVQLWDKKQLVTTRRIVKL